MKRDAKADLEICQKATPGPWKIGWLVRIDELHGKVKRPQDIYVKFERVEDAEFTSVAREALPYWIKRAQEAEDFLKSIFCSCGICFGKTDCGECKETERRIKEFLGTEPCDK